MKDCGIEKVKKKNPIMSGKNRVWFHIEGEEKLFAVESFLSVFTSLFCLQTLDMT